MSSGGFNVEATLTGSESLQGVLATMRANGGKVSESARREIGEQFILSTHERWAQGVAPDGTPWPVSARAMGFGGHTMIDDGILLASIHYELDGDDLALFSDDRRMRAHQEGMTITPKKARALAIPLTRAIAKAYQAGVSIRDQYPTAFVLKTSGGALFLVRRNEAFDRKWLKARLKGRDYAPASSSPYEFLFALVGAVHEPKREGIGFSTEDLAFAESVILRSFGISGGQA